MEAILKKEVLSNKTLCRVFAVFTFVILTCLGAFVRIPLPFTPVPLTLQTFFVLLSGAFLANNLGVLAQLSYIFLGVLGLPVFSGAASGWPYLFGPTGGYIFGFVLANLFIGYFINIGRRNFLLAFAIFCLADLALLSLGTLWLKFIFGYPFGKLLLIGFIPFLPGDLLKATLASFVYWKLRGRIEAVL